MQLNPTSTGIEVILETAGQLEPTTSVVDDALIVDIPNAVLTKSTKRTEVSSGRTLTADEEFQAANPTEGIALVTATNLPNNRVRVAITGTTAPPTASVRASEGGIVLSVAVFEAETANDEEEEIEIIVTGEQEDRRIPTQTVLKPLKMTTLGRHESELCINPSQKFRSTPATRNRLRPARQPQQRAIS